MKIVDPLRLFEYFDRRHVWDRRAFLEADPEGRKVAFYRACRVLETHFGIHGESITARRRTRDPASFLPLTCPTPEWMLYYMKPDPEPPVVKKDCAHFVSVTNEILELT